MRDLRPLLILASIVALCWLIYLLGPVLTPFAAGALLAYLGDPLADRLERIQVGRFSLGRTGAVILVFLLIFGTITLIVLLLVPALVEQFRVLQEQIPRYVNWILNTAIPWVQAKLGLPQGSLDTDELATLAQDYWKELGTAALGVVGNITAGGQAVLVWLANLLLIPVVTFYLLRDWDVVVEKVRGQIPQRIEPRVSLMAREMDEVVGAFFRGQLLVMLSLGIIYAVGLWLIGIDSAFLIGTIAGLLSIVPYLGTFVGVAAALIAAIVQHGDWLHPLLVGVVFAVGQTLEGTVLTPKFVGDRVGLHPVAVIFAVMAGGQLFGFVGLLLALPVAAALMVLLRHADDDYKSSALYRKRADGEVTSDQTDHGTGGASEP